MLIDKCLPHYDVVERHQMTIHASAAASYAALLSIDFAESGVLRALLAIRALPAWLFARSTRQGRTSAPRRALTLDTIEAGGFVRLAAIPPEEIVFGVEGRFWTLDGGRCTPAAPDFLASEPRPGTARGVWNFAFTPVDAMTTLASTETRVLCADAHTRRRFLPYWVVIRLGSGLIRRVMLRQVRDAAERRVRTAST